MINGIHTLLYSRDAEAARGFFRDTLKLGSVDSGDGWLIFACPPTEIAVHPSQKDHGPELYFMCDDVERTVAELEAKGVKTTRPITNQGWGRVTEIRIPGGLEFGLYEPQHKTALGMTRKKGMGSRATKTVGKGKGKGKRS